MELSIEKHEIVTVPAG